MMATDKNNRQNSAKHCETTTLNDGKISCVACKTEILAGTYLCPVCKTYQIRRLRWPQQYSSYAAAITAAVALVTYAIGAIPELSKRLFWHDSLNVISLWSLQDIVLSNSGDGSVYVNKIRLQVHVGGPFEPHGFLSATTLPMNLSIKPGETISHKFYAFKTEQEEWTLANVSDAQWKDLLKKKVSVQFPSEECFNWGFVSKNDSVFDDLKMGSGNGARYVPAR